MAGASVRRLNRGLIRLVDFELFDDASFSRFADFVRNRNLNVFFLLRLRLALLTLLLEEELLLGRSCRSTSFSVTVCSSIAGPKISFFSILVTGRRIEYLSSAAAPIPHAAIATTKMRSRGCNFRCMVVVRYCGGNSDIQ